MTPTLSMPPARAVIRIGTAGWAVPRRWADRFPEDGSLLARYAARFDCAEINSTFYRSHRPTTYERWAATVPDHFRFAVKMPRAITHERRLQQSEALVEAFLAEIAPLGPKAGPILVQLPPSFAFERESAARFFADLRRRTNALVACEPRHPTWFAETATAIMREQRIARVAADPARVPAAAEPGGDPALAYFRLHGSPRMYFSPYAEDYLLGLVERLRTVAAAEVWCIFDNTGSGAAAGDALAVSAALRAAGRLPKP